MPKQQNFNKLLRFDWDHSFLKIMAQGQKGSYKNDVKTYFCNKNFNNLSSFPPNNLADNITRNEDNFSVVGTKLHNITENGASFWKKFVQGEKWKFWSNNITISRTEIIQIYKWIWVSCLYNFILMIEQGICNTKLIMNKPTENNRA